MTPTGDLLTHWTARSAFGLYVLALAVHLLVPPAPARNRFYRLCWTLGWAAFAVHVACAFHFVHGWSHADAFRETARQTADLTGVASGFGLYLNYAFLLAWTADVAWLWLRRDDPHRRRWVGVVLHAFLTFMWFNATVVFPTGPTRWAGVAAFALLAVLYVRRWTERRMRHRDTEAQRLT